MKPIIYEGDYLITYHDINDNELHQEIGKSLQQSRALADQYMSDHPEVRSRRILRCFDNTKYNKWTPRL